MCRFFLFEVGEHGGTGLYGSSSVVEVQSPQTTQLFTPTRAARATV
ncbi:MAG: hypothetical protein RLZ36_1341, partial [Pseudomonadota bacterium]